MTVKLGCGICDARWEAGTPRPCKCNQNAVNYKFKGEAVNNSITFLAGSELKTEILRLSCEGITANPDIPVDDAARLVLDALDDRIKVMMQKAVEAEREACAKVVDAWGEWTSRTELIAAAIRARG